MTLKNLVGQKVINEILKSKKNGTDSRVLVVDRFSLRMLSACLKMHEIALEGITRVQDINKSREPLHYLEAVYILSPVNDSVKPLITDFGFRRNRFSDFFGFRISKITDFLFRRKRKERRTQYKAAHVYFTKACPKELSKELYKHISGKYIRTMKYINIAFIPCESQVFSLDFPDGFQCYYNQNRISQRAAAMERMAEQIATLCATLGVYPAVRYRADNERNIEFAQIIQHKLNRYKADDPTMGDGPEKSRSQLLVIDRGVDGVSPLLHELTFQAMAYDLLPSENDVNKFLLTSQYKSGVEKKVLVDENDDRWKELRHQHIEIVFKNISKNLKTYVTYENNLKKSLTASDKSSISDLKMIKKMLEYRKELSNYSSLAEDCLKKYQSKVSRLCKVEQDLAMGVDAEGDEVKDIMRLMHPFLAEENVSPMDKIRIILL
ncbi:hypothetical protein QYM36_014048 [Artemia franciscana]|uniref:Uncharacterized protein n=1 Tax=Artemia franciscana TaxID=6661 RepID=A0AA88HBC3_ARTSF|nr:hypothetical protein QYM36_014048 [Artemia franciscana]